LNHGIFQMILEYNFGQKTGQSYKQDSWCHVFIKFYNQ
jgi:hypothetical protein